MDPDEKPELPVAASQADGHGTAPSRLRVRTHELGFHVYDRARNQAALVGQNHELLSVSWRILEQLGTSIASIAPARLNKETTTSRRLLPADEPAALLAVLVDSSIDAIISKDVNGRVTSWNRAAERLFGFSAEEMRGQPILRIIPPELRFQEAEIMASIGRGESVPTFDTERMRKDGTRVPVSLSISPIRDGNDRIIGASKIARDITERRRAEQALRAADREKNEFLAMLAHELRNPLAAIRNAGAILGRTLRGDDNAESAVALIDRQTTQLSRLVDDLLDVSRIAGGRIELKPELLEIGTILEQAVEAVEPLISEKQHRLRIDRPEEMLYVRGDRARLVQAVCNLLHNSAKFTDPAGQITLEVLATRDQIEIEVRDTGRGIAAGLLPRVFELFVQSERAIDRSHGGLGIGLAVVKRLAEMHGGTVRVRSEGPGRGAAFTIRLPRVRPPQAGLDSSVPRPALRAQRILVVDDNIDAADSLVMLLKLDGHEVDVVYDASTAVAAIEACKPDVVFLDIGMPQLDGYEVARQVRSRASDGLQRLRLIAITGHILAVDHARAEAAGFDAVLMKPADPDALDGVLARLEPRSAPPN
jgi:PAS domain S-box-containing protein